MFPLTRLYSRNLAAISGPSVTRNRAAFTTLCLCLWACGGSDSPVAGPGMFTLPIQHGGIDREAIVYVPESYTAEQASPVLLNFHGFGGTAEDHMLWADMRPQADAENFIVVYPQGSLLDGDSHWNTSPPSDDNKSGADDFGFIEALLDEISAPYTVDRDRIYAAGYSNGGMFAFAMACYRSDQIAGVASVSGAMLDDIGESCTSPPTSIITLHGTEDEVLGYDGGYGFRSAEALVDYWLGVNGIDSEPSVDAGAQLESFRYTGGTQGTEVHHHRVIDGGHVWFELETEDTNDLIWTFLARFSTEGRL